MKVREFEGKNVYIVGGSSGIGLATAELLSERGSNVIIFARGKERLEEALERVEARRKSAGQRLTYKPLDVGGHEEVERVMGDAVRDFGPPDILINSAGRALPDYFENITFEQFDASMKLHAYGCWSTIKVLLPYLEERQGYIVNVSSVVGFLGTFGYTDYAASKFAVMGLSEALRGELKPRKVGISVLCPPDTDTPGFEVENRNKPPETAAISENAGLVQPEEVASALVRGMEKGRFFIEPGSVRMIHLARRFVPRLVDLVMDMEVRKVQKKRCR